MNFKATALKDVIIRVTVPCTEIKDLGDGAKISHPSERDEWVHLKAGEVRENLLFVKGIHPSCLPNHITDDLGGVRMIVPFWKMEDLPQNFFGLYILDHVPPIGLPV